MKTTRRTRKNSNRKAKEVPQWMRDFWAGSVSAGVLADYADGRAVVVDCDAVAKAKKK